MEIRNYRKLFNGDTTQFGRVALLYGGNSAEREVSLLSGQSVLGALKNANVDVVEIDCQGGYLNRIQQENIDRVFIMVHGRGGEDGKLQAVLSELGIPFTGSDHSACALSIDKQMTKKVWQSSGIPTPKHFSLEDHTDWDGVLKKLEGKVFVKPNTEGSSIGMSLVTNAPDLKKAYESASKFDTKVIAEKYIDGEEYTVSILNGNVLPVVNIKANSDFYDYNAKYLSNRTQYFCPSGLDVKKEQQVKSIARGAFEMIGCSGWGRVDILIDKMGNINLLEINTVPGMTNHSLVPIAARAVGLSFDELVLEILMQTMKANHA